MKTIEEIRAFFAADIFAMEAGIVVDAVDEEGAVCSVELEERHSNAQGFAQGGLIYTLADLAFAAAANGAGVPTVTLQSNIHYLRPAKGGRLTATARRVQRGRSVCVFEVDVRDERNTPIALATMTGFSKPE